MRRRDVDTSHADFGQPYPCPVCKAPELARQRVDRIFGEAGVTAEFADCSFATFQALGPRADQNAAVRIEDWAAHGDSSLYLHGSVGRGKTGLAHAAMRYRIEHDHCAALFKPTPDLLGRIRDSYSNHATAPTEQEVVDTVCDVPLLILDDIGTDKPTEWVKTTLFRILNQRYMSHKATILTSNYALPQLGQQLGGRISTRIKSMCWPNVIHIQGQNLRD